MDSGDKNGGVKGEKENQKMEKKGEVLNKKSL